MHNNKHTCPAFFTDATVDPSGSYSPCTALGGGAFKFANKTFTEIWSSNELEDVRQRSLQGQQLDMCRRCWSEERLGHKSERIYQREKSDNLDYVSNYQLGPKNLNIKVSNICNLRCRTCQSYDSYLYHLEGKHYEEKYGLSNTIYTREKFKKHFTNEQLDELYSYIDNVEKIELYGGEPFLDEQVPKLLLRIVESGKASNIDLKVSTNGTHGVSETWEKILLSFRSVTVNVSIDAVRSKLTYMRHPAEWRSVYKTIKKLLKIKQQSNWSISILPVICVSALNVWDFHEVFDECVKLQMFHNVEITPFIILVQWPSYYCVNVIPDTIKPIVKEYLESKAELIGKHNVASVVKLLETEPKLFDESQLNVETPWEEFKFWTKEKDLYRNEDYVTMFPEYGKILTDHGVW
jgi:radical SAM protein with 4Fe4S-binding SPASM domain